MLSIPSFILVAFVIFLVAGEVFMFIALHRTSKALHSIFTNQEEKDIFEVLLRQEKKSKELAKELQRLINGCALTAEIAAQSMQKVGIVKFSPFHATGGDQSFCLALLDRGGNGFVLTSLHTNEMTRVYAKPVHNGGSEVSLSREEEKAIAAAMQENKA